VAGLLGHHDAPSERWAGESGAGTTRRASRESRRRATTTRPVRAASKAIERPKLPVGEMSKPRDRQNPAQPSAKHSIPEAGTVNRSWHLSWNHSTNHSAYHSANSERAPERRRCGGDVEKRRDARSRTATRENSRSADPAGGTTDGTTAGSQPEHDSCPRRAHPLARAAQRVGCSGSARRLYCRREHLCFLPPLRRRIHKWTSCESKRFHCRAGSQDPSQNHPRHPGDSGPLPAEDLARVAKRGHSRRAPKSGLWRDLLVA
jgi:hypothetical protein